MKRQYDFTKGKRQKISPAQAEPPGKTRITIRIDEDLMDYFLKKRSPQEVLSAIKPSSKCSAALSGRTLRGSRKPSVALFGKKCGQLGEPARESGPSASLSR